MKLPLLAGACLVVTVSCANLRAQDSNSIQSIHREVNPIDAAVHAEVGDGSRETPSTAPLPKNQTASPGPSLFQPVRQIPDARFWPGATSPTVDLHDHRKNPNAPPVDSRTASQTEKIHPDFSAGPTHFGNATNSSVKTNRFRSPDEKPGQLSGLPPSGDSTGLRTFNSALRLPPQRPSNTSFSSPFRESSSGFTSAFSFQSPFATKTISPKHELAKSVHRKSRVQAATGSRRGIAPMPGTPSKTE